MALLKAGQTERAVLVGDIQRRGYPKTALETLAIENWHILNRRGSKNSGKPVKEEARDLSLEQQLDFTSPVFYTTNEDTLIITPTILVGFHSYVSSKDAETLLTRHDTGKIVTKNWANMQGVYCLRSPHRNGFDVLTTANRLALLDEVRFAEPDMIITGKGSVDPNDAGFTNCWGIHNTGQTGGTPDMDMDGPEAWDISTGKASVIVVIIDTGVQQNHPDIHQVTGMDFTSDGPGDGGPGNIHDNHGTPVAGCVSAILNNSIGTVGIAPGCRVASARTFITTNSNGSWTSQSSWTVNALSWAETLGARVTNNSNRYGFSSAAIDGKYQATRDNGIIHFSSSGNQSASTPTYPASLDSVNAVGAVDSNGDLAWFSNFGTGTAFVAPGQSIYSTDRTGSAGWDSGDYTFTNGTSFASPYAAGVAALILSIDNSLSAVEVEQIIQNSAVDLGVAGYDTTFGWGFVNAHLPLEGLSGCLQVTLSPQEAIDSGAQWRVVGSATWRDHEETVCDLAAGSTLIEYKPITGWVPPSNEGVLITVGETTSLISGPYVAVAPVSFNDPNLQIAVELALGVSDPIPQEMSNLTALVAGIVGIEDLTGLQYASNLNVLWLPSNQIKDLSSLLPLHQLTFVNLLGNPLTTTAYCDQIPQLQENNNNLVSLQIEANSNPFSQDCSVTAAELMGFSEKWLQNSCDSDNGWCGGADLLHHGRVDLRSFAVISQYWME